MTPTQADADTLYRRLESGWDKIEQAEQTSRDKTFLEDFWLSLLREYEAVCRELQRAHDDEQQHEYDEEREQQRTTQKGMFG